MAASLKTVALLVANPALSSILSSTLAGVPSLRVRPFESLVALTTYMQLAPADIVVLDLGEAEAVASGLRQDRAIASRDLQIIALATAGDAGVRPDSIDEMIIKPMSPRYLVERVLARLRIARRPERRLRALYKRDWSAFGDNIVPLFGAPPPEPRA